MADQNTVVHIGENSPEQVAYKLMQDIMRSEKRTIFTPDQDQTKADRIYVLDLYASCLNTVRDPDLRFGSDHG